MEGQKDAKRKRRLEQELERVRSNPRARQASAAAAIRGDGHRSGTGRQAGLRDPDTSGPKARQPDRRGGPPDQGFRRPSSHRRLVVLAPRNGIVGVIGPNGVGKTTLFSMLVGDEKPDTGSIRLRHRADRLCRPESRQPRSAQERPGKPCRTGSTTSTWVARDAEPGLRQHVRLQGSDQQKPAGILSGGERNRLNLASRAEAGRQLAAPGRADKRPRRRDAVVTGECAARAPGCAVVVSHDRGSWTGSRPHLAYEGDEANPARWFWFEGNFAAYETNKVERLPARRQRDPIG